MDQKTSKSNRGGKIRVLLITAPSTGSGWGRYTSSLAEALKKQDVEVYIESLESPLRFKKNILLSPYYAFKIFFKYKGKIDLVHCVVEPFAFIAQITAGFFDIPYVLTLHGTYSILPFSQSIIGRFQKGAYRNANSIIAVSSYTKKRVLEFLPNLNIEVIPNGVFMVSGSNTRNLSKEKIILGVGGVKRRKGYHLVIEALAKIKEQIVPFTYYIVGDFQDKTYVQYLRSLISKYNLGNFVELKGHVSDQELDYLYDKADIFVLTPVSEGLRFEGFGLVFLEANARGIPVIGMKGSGAEEAIKDGFSGYLAEMGEGEDLMNKIVSLLSDSDKYRFLSSEALKWSLSMGWEDIIKRYITVYNQYKSNG